MSRHPVTNSQYDVSVKDSGYKDARWWSEGGRRWLAESEAHEPEYWRRGKWNNPSQPVVGVSFWEAEAFSAWAGGRLPTEDEWECAARGPQGLEYPWGDEWCDDPTQQGRVVVRGGSWFGAAGVARSAGRSGFLPDGRVGSVGFRVVGAVGVRTPQPFAALQLYVLGPVVED